MYVCVYVCERAREDLGGKWWGWFAVSLAQVPCGREACEYLSVAVIAWNGLPVYLLL